MRPKNYLEDLVIKETERVLSLEENANICHCEQCKWDIVTYALNHLKPHYIVSDRGHIHAEIDTVPGGQLVIDVAVAVSNGVKTVSSRPRHNGKDRKDSN